MSEKNRSRRDILKAGSGLAAALFAEPICAAAPEPVSVTPRLIEAARREGKVAWYATLDLPVVESIARAFEAKYSGIAFFFSSRRRHTRWTGDWSSDVCSSD